MKMATRALSAVTKKEALSRSWDDLVTTIGVMRRVERQLLDKPFRTVNEESALAIARATIRTLRNAQKEHPERPVQMTFI